MKKGFHNALKLTTAITLFMLLGACAGTNEATRTETMLQEAMSTAQQALSEARSAQNTAEAAYAKAESAQETANEALDRTAEYDAKMNRMFEKSMRK